MAEPQVCSTSVVPMRALMCFRSVVMVSKVWAAASNSNPYFLAFLVEHSYDCGGYRQNLRQQRIHPQIGNRCTEHGSYLGLTRWAIERTFAWLYQFRRMRVRCDRRADMHEGFLRLGCAIICWRLLRNALHDPFPFC